MSSLHGRDDTGLVGVISALDQSVGPVGVISGCGHWLWSVDLLDYLVVSILLFLSMYYLTTSFLLSVNFCNFYLFLIFSFM